MLHRQLLTVWEIFTDCGSAPLAKRPENTTLFDSPIKRSCSFFLSELVPVGFREEIWKLPEKAVIKYTFLHTWKFSTRAKSTHLWETMRSTRPCWTSAVKLLEGSCCLRPWPRQNLQWLLWATAGTLLWLFQGPGNWKNLKYIARARRFETKRGWWD